MIKTCICGKVFEAKARKTKYCSKKCFHTLFTHSKETKERMSKAKIGKPSWNKGKVWSKEHREKLSKAHKESPLCQEHCRKLKEFNKGKRRSPATEFKKGQKPSNFKGRSMHSLGYVCIHSPYHPFVDTRNNVLEHRLVVEKMIGRFLQPSEMVHHINHKRADNRPENLMAFINRTSHVKFECGKHINPSNIIFDGRSIDTSRSENVGEALSAF